MINSIDYESSSIGIIEALILIIGIQISNNLLFGLPAIRASWGPPARARKRAGYLRPVWTSGFHKNSFTFVTRIVSNSDNKIAENLYIVVIIAANTHHYTQKCYHRNDMAPSPTKNEAKRKTTKIILDLKISTNSNNNSLSEPIITVLYVQRIAYKWIGDSCKNMVLVPTIILDNQTS